MNNLAIGNIIRFIESKEITHLVVHGLKSGEHTHRYIHESIYQTFLYIADKIDRHIDVLWCDDTFASQNIYKPILYNPMNNYLVFSTPHLETDKFLPVLDNAYYIVHYRRCVVYTDVPITKYDELLQSKRAVKYVEYRHSPCNVEYHENGKNGVFEVENTPFWFDTNSNEAHLAWATNLFPEDIDANIAKIQNSTEPTFKRNSYFCGSVWRANKDEINEWEKLCERHAIECIIEREKNETKHQTKVGESMLAPAIQGKSQRHSAIKYYIPCRIFKNISYGAVPITNNIGVYNMMKDYGMLYDADLEKLMEKCIANYDDILQDYQGYKKKQIHIMEYVRDHHTFLNRIATLIQYGFE